MINTSTEFTTKIKALSRRTKGFIIIDFAQDLEYPFATITANGYNTYQLADGRFMSSDYNYYNFDDSTPTLPDLIDSTPLYVDATPIYIDGTPTAVMGDAINGWIGTNISDSSGNLSSSEVIILEYLETIKAINFWVMGKSTNYPVDFTIEVYYSSAWHTIATVTSNTEYQYIYHSTSTLNITKFRLTITKISKALSYANLYECGAVCSVIYEDSNLVSMNILEECSANTTNPIGAVSSNTCDIEILNYNRWYMPTNSVSPFYGMMKPRIRVRPFVGLEIEADIYETIPLGIFWTDDWDINSNDMNFKLTAYDRLKTLNDLTIASTRVQENTTIKELLELISDNIGLSASEYNIDSGLTQAILFGWANKTLKFRDILQTISEAGNCFIGINRHNVLAAEAYNMDATPLDTWQDTDMLYDINNPFSYSTAFDKAKVQANIPKITNAEILNVDNIVIPTGGRTLTNMAFSSNPVLNLTSINIVNTTNVTIESIEYNVNDITIIFGNTGTEETISIKAAGNIVQTVIEPVTYDAGLDFNKEIEINNSFIQNTSLASTYGEDFIEQFSDPGAIIESNSRGNPAICLNDIIMVHSPTDKITSTNIRVLRQEIIWDEALSIKVTGRKV